MRVLSVGRFQIAFRRRPAAPCSACEGHGWFHTKGGPVRPAPPGYDGVALCPCGTAVYQLAEGARTVRRARGHAPF
jgi:hypothetical protein